MGARLSVWLIVVLLAVVLIGPVQRANASPGRQVSTDTPTPTETATPTITATPTPTGTPGFQTSYTLDSGNTLIVERRWTFGELAIFLAVLVNAALYGLHWIFDVARREVR